MKMPFFSAVGYAYLGTADTLPAFLTAVTDTDTRQGTGEVEAAKLSRNHKDTAVIQTMPKNQPTNQSTNPKPDKEVLPTPADHR